MSRKTKIIKHKSFKHKINALIKKKKIKQIKVYPKEKCHYIDADGKRCKRNAIGSGQLCAKHGGERDRSNLIEEGSLSYTLMKKSLKKIQVYDPNKHPLKFIQLSRQGLSEVEIAAELGVSVHTMQKWAEQYELFSEAYDIGMALHESWWLSKGKEGLENPRDFNTPLYKFLTGNKLGYSDKVESKNFNVNAGVLVVPRTPASLEEWEKKEDCIDAEMD